MIKFLSMAAVWAAWALASTSAWPAEPAAEPARWPQFRGPGGTGTSNEDHPLPVGFGPGERLLWKTALPGGLSSPCVWGDRIYLTALSEGKLETLCLDRRQGEIVWRQTAPAKAIEKVHEISSPATATPVADGERVYVYFGSFGLLCYDLEGREQWQLPLATPELYFGTGTSPILAGELLLLNVDQQGDSYLLAVERASGRIAWKQDRPLFQRGWSSPVHVRHDGHDQVVVLGTNRLVAYNLADGQERWSVGGLPPSTISTPVVGDGRLYLAATDYFGEPENVVQLPTFDDFAKDHDQDQDGRLAEEEIPEDFALIRRGGSDGAGDMTLRSMFKQFDQDKDQALNGQEWAAMNQLSRLFALQFKAAVVAVRLGGEADVTDTHVAWQETQGVPEVPSPLFYRGRLYLIKNGGIVHCRNATNGKLLYRARLGAGGGYYASPVAGDGKIYAANDVGVVTVFAAGDAFQELARNDLGERIMATPAIVKGKLYIRTDSCLYAFGEVE